MSALVIMVVAFIASTLPVTTLLQPRDFINSHQLMVAMALLILGVFFSAFGGNLQIVAPAVQMTPARAPPMWPFLFITIACGAISGFHSLIAVGTALLLAFATGAGGKGALKLWPLFGAVNQTLAGPVIDLD